MGKERPKFDIKNAPKCLQPYLEARQNGTLPQYFLEVLRIKRDSYLDDLPKVDVRTLATLDEKGRFVGDNYKCRGNYIWGLSGILQHEISDGAIIEPQLIEKIEAFGQHDFRYIHGEFTTQQEIDMMNQILADTIGYLESQKVTVA